MMSNLMPIQSRLRGLSALETNLWKAFKGAEEKYIPSTLNPWSVTANFLRLRRQGYLRLYEFYPLYGVIAISAATAAVRGNHWMFAVYIAALLPMFVFLGKYIKQFAFEKTNILGLDRLSFGVANLPLLVYGMARIVSEKLEPVKDVVPAPLTKENLASIAKLVKGGHEHGEVGYGLDDVLRKWVFGGIASAAVYASTKAGEVAPLVDKLRHLAANDAGISAAAVTLCFVGTYFLYQLIFSPANEKRRRRRYLLALNAMQESLPVAVSRDLEVPHAMGLRPGNEGSTGEPRPVVGSHRHRVDAEVVNQIQ
ncbi:hypothetical protein LNV28_07645 [Paucibacter sp. DJ2R-2]|nr:hypothetical protein [Paucibacter sp. DJ2R-2]MCV2438168.1 hypothetical protein [Paucibacter sp. DJ2R-2]